MICWMYVAVEKTDPCANFSQGVHLKPTLWELIAPPPQPYHDTCRQHKGRSMTYGVVLEARGLDELEVVVDRLVRGVDGPGGEAAEERRPFDPGE